MKVLVTGGGGYVGSHVCKLLRTRGITHMALDNFSTGHVEQLFETPHIQGDITDPLAIERAFAHFHPDAVIHLAALATIPDCTKDPARTQAVNVEGTRRILDAMVLHGVRSIVFASTCGLYAATPTPRPFTESDPLDPPSVYGRSKLEAEKLLARYYKESAISYIALRIFNVAGAEPEAQVGEDHAPETHLIPLVMRAALTGKPLHVFGNDYPTQDGTNVRDYIHVWDIAHAALRGLEHLRSKNEGIVINTGSGIPTSVLEIIQAVERHTGKKVPAIMSGRREGDAPYLLGDNSRLQKVLGYAPQFSQLEEIVASAWRWHSREQA